MHVLFCGTGGGGDAFDLDRANAGVLVEHGDTAVLLDCGAGSLRQLVAAGKRLTDIDSIAISHLHHDHVLGLVELFGRLVALNAGNPPPVYGPAGTTEFVRRVREVVRLLARLDASTVDAIRGIDVEPGTEIEVGRLRMLPFEVRHSSSLQSFGWRVSSTERRVVYSGDTAAVPEVMIPVARGCDLLIHDAFSSVALERLVESRADDLRQRLPSLFPQIHGVARDVGALATAAAVERLALMSISPFEDLDTLRSEVQATYKGPLLVAADGLDLTL